MTFVATSFNVPQTIVAESSFEFGIRINPSGPSLVNTAIVTIHQGKVVKVENINEMQFIQEIAGVVESKANRAPEDLFAKNGVYSCTQDRDTIRWKYRAADTSMNRKPGSRGQYKSDYIVQDRKISCPIIGELWKLRYKYDIRIKNYNYTQKAKPDGWSRDKFWPTLEQVNYLKATYGADGINDFIYGEKLFKLLKDVQDSTWIDMYKNL